MAGALTRMLGLTPAAGGGGTWTPASLTGIQAWWDSDQEATLATTWTDRSGNSHTVTLGGDSSVKASIIGGKKATLFDGNDYSEVNISVTGWTAASYGAVAKVTSDPTSGNQNGPLIDRVGSTGRWPQTDGHIRDGFGSADGARDFGDPTPSLTSPRMYSCHSATNDHRAYLDGTLLASFSTNTTSFGSGVTRIGASNDLNNWLNGYIAEMVICNVVMSTSDRQKLEGYFAHKYGLTGNLPGGHPYISSPP